jgi:Copper type II ascorbate-dependent monooxygenase, C-terminal domain
MVIPDGPPPPPGFTPLIGRSWSLNPGDTDTYRCVRITVPNDMYITAFHVDAPTGTHHTVLTQGSTGSDGEYNCTAGSLDSQMLWASGVGTDDLAFPDGVGFKLAGGQKINLNLHLFDATDQPLQGTTTIYVKTLPSQPAQLAEMVFSGTLNINVPAHSTGMASGGCTLQHDANIVATWPHMHQTATRQLVELTPSGTTTPMTVLDTPYAFTEQKNYPWTPPLVWHTGDKIKTTCFYNNTTNAPMMFGESSLDEMCFTGIYRYPATGGVLLGCISN